MKLKIQIKHRITDQVLFEAESTSLKATLELATQKGANLQYAKLQDAKLQDANLQDANLQYANLQGANLQGANLQGANLQYANLQDANLQDANLQGANLQGANLQGAIELNKYLCTPLCILLDQIGKIRAYKLITKNGEGPFNGGIKYKIGKTVTVEDADTDDTIQCSRGISLATLDWCIKEWRKDYRILIAEFTKKDIAAIPIATDGKFRVRKCKIVGEKDLKKIGLTI